MKKYKHKYRTTTTRASWWNYGWNGTYFVTICTKNRKHFFGEIKNGIMGLSEIGVIANQCWLDIPLHFPFVSLEAHIIMPNHVHGIIIIQKENHQYEQAGNTFGPQSQNLASVIRGFKVGVTKNARQLNPYFAWQARYHEHIVRDDRAFFNISKYIIDNPVRWAADTHNVS